MKSNAGVWIDHREAVIVVLSETGETTSRILSNIVKPHDQEAPPDDIRERAHKEHLSRYYEEVITFLHDAGAILIIGPGEAKAELKKRFETHKSETRAIEMETSDNMSEPQIAALVRRRFTKSHTLRS